MKYAVGIDVGGTNTRVALINEQYEIKERVQFGSDPKDPMKTLNQINDVIKEFGQEIEGIIRFDQWSHFNTAKSSRMA